MIMCDHVWSYMIIYDRTSNSARGAWVQGPIADTWSEAVQTFSHQSQREASGERDHNEEGDGKESNHGPFHAIDQCKILIRMNPSMGCLLQPERGSIFQRWV